MPRANIDIPDDLHREAKLAAVKAGITLRDLIVRGIQLATEELEKENR